MDIGHLIDQACGIINISQGRGPVAGGADIQHVDRLTTTKGVHAVAANFQIVFWVPA